MSNTITENNILESLISIYPSMLKTNDVKYISVANALTWIKIGRWADKVSQVKNGVLNMGRSV